MGSVAHSSLQTTDCLLGLDCWFTTAVQRNTVKPPLDTDLTSSACPFNVLTDPISDPFFWGAFGYRRYHGDDRSCSILLWDADAETK